MRIMMNEVKTKITNCRENCTKLGWVLWGLIFGVISNIGAQNIEFTQKTNDDNPLFGAEIGSSTTSITVDIDNDGDYDLFIGNLEGSIQYYKNISTEEAPNVFEEQLGANNPFDGVDVGSKATIAFVDIDFNSTFDAFIGCTNSVRYFKNTGTVSQPVFEEQTGEDNPLAAVTYTGDRAFSLSFADIDLDSDLEAFVGWIDYDVENSSGIDYYHNIGTNLSPEFEERTGEANPFESFNQLYPTPIFIDLDNDTDMDAFIGTGDGTFLYFENTTELSELKTEDVDRKTFAMYPNPAQSIVNFGLKSATANVKIVSLSGMELLRTTITKQRPYIDVSSLAQGIYLVVFDDGIDKLTKKLVITK